MSKPMVEIALEDVQLLWDTVVSSMDWGSGFLDAEEMLRILVIGARFGFDISAHSSHFPNIVGEWERKNPKPKLDYTQASRVSGPAFALPAVLRTPDKRTKEWRRYQAALQKWDAARTSFFESKLAEAAAKYDMTDPCNPPQEDK